MKRFYVTFLLVVSFFLSFAQSSIVNYYSSINKAELQICDNNYNKALSNFDSAFQNMYPWVIDICNAINCAIDASDTSRVEVYLGLLMPKGSRFIHKGTFLYNRIINFYPKFKQKIDSYNGPFLCQEVDTVFLKELKVRLADDQRINRLRISFFEKRYNDLTAQAYIDSFSLVLLKNGLWLKDWILKNGYPKEECYYYPNNEDNPLRWISTLLVHYFSEHWTLFSPLKECVFNGELHPIDLARHLLRHTPVRREHFKEYGHYCYVFMGGALEAIHYENIEKINENREGILLQPYEDYLKKIDYYFRNGQVKYNFRTELGVMNFTHPDTLEKYLNETYRNSSNH